MQIRIVNLKSYTPLPNEVLIKIDRSSILGNPFFMKNESMRDEVCNKYITYFNSKINTNFNSDLDTDFDKALLHICDELIKSNVALGCWCYPKRCHAQTIIDWVLGQLLESYQIN